jgi:hypothetical protein
VMPARCGTYSVFLPFLVFSELIELPGGSL